MHSALSFFFHSLLYLSADPLRYRATAYLLAFASNSTTSLPTPTPAEQMLTMVSKYTALLPTRNTPTGPPSLAVVVLTGATGSLGAQLLAQLLADGAVKRVYCLVRARDDQEARERVGRSMEERELEGIEDERIVALAADLGTERLGLEEGRYERIVGEATAVLHNAW